MSEKLALLGGQKTIQKDMSKLFVWPIVTPEHEKAVLNVLRERKMSGIEVSTQFQSEYAKQIGRKYGLMCNNGTAAIHCGFYGIGIGVGDEVICPSITYWASVLQVYSLGATPVFADIDPKTLCLDPDDFERCITKRTKAVIVIHYAGHPANMDRIMKIAKEHKVKVFEDCSHSHAALYKGKETGTFGDAAGFSLMTGKSFAIGEAGILFTDDQEIYEKALLFGHYERHNSIELENLKKYSGLPLGGCKYRPHQLSSAFGLVQLNYYKQQFAEIDKAMTYFCDLIDELPGIKTHRPDKNSGSSKGGWYFPLAHYNPQEFGELSNARFTQALQAEGVASFAGCNKPLHTHVLLKDFDIYGHGRPTRLAHLPENMTIDQLQKPLRVAETINDKIITLPWFKHFDKDSIEVHAAAYKKVIENYKFLLKGDEHKRVEGNYNSSFKK